MKTLIDCLLRKAVAEGLQCGIYVRHIKYPQTINTYLVVTDTGLSILISEELITDFSNNNSIQVSKRIKILK